MLFVLGFLLMRLRVISCLGPEFDLHTITHAKYQYNIALFSALPLHSIRFMLPCRQPDYYNCLCKSAN